MNNSKITLSPTSISQYIRLENCERFLRFRLVPEDLSRLEKRLGVTVQPLTPLLSESGADFEKNIAEKLAVRGEKIINLTDQGPEATLQCLQDVKTPIFLYQPSLKGLLGDLPCAGRADMLRVAKDRQGRLQILIADIKASRQEKTDHRVQVAIYALMVQHMAMTNQLPIGEIQGTVLTQQDDGSYPTITADTPCFDLETYFTILDRLVVFPDSVVNRVIEQPFENTFYHLNYKCDGCLYNSICMVDSAERLDITLTPQISAVEKRVLNESGVRTINHLASLMDLPPEGQWAMLPSPSHQEVLSLLKNRWPVGPNLPFLVQRAKSALRNFEQTKDYRTFIIGSGFGTLPDDNQYPHLVKVFVDAQRDYLHNKIYLLGALIKGPRGEKSIISLCPHPPDDQNEGELLVNWVKSVIGAVAQVAKNEMAPVHIYCYNRYDQKVLLEGLKRHLNEVAAIPAFYDLLTQSPALTQPMISFISDEVHERFNPGRACASLHDIARWLRFDWKDEEYDYFRLFRARIFDNRRDYLRLPNGQLRSTDQSTPKDAPGRLTIESASRFNSQIPLEYAYAAWGCLPEVAQADSRLLSPFRQVNLRMLEKFAEMRVKALAHIEASFRRKSTKVEKNPLRIPDLTSADDNLSLSRSLSEFLFIEHHTSLQNHLLTYSWTIDKRVQSGLTMLLQCNGCVETDLYSFVPQFSSLGLDPVLTMNACKLKEGDWVVLNPAAANLSPNQLKHGRLAIIESILPDQVILKLMSITFKDSFFRYFHKRDIVPLSGDLYVIDQMADDLNSDKILESLGYTHNNIFFQWLLTQPANHTVPENVQLFYQKFADYVDQLLKNRGRKLTKMQREAIADHYDKPLILVQGPPGTGKSYTLAWAVLARIAAANVQGAPCRVLISCKTHNAINVVLKALAEAQKQVGIFASPQMGGLSIFSTEIYKLINEEDDPVPDGVRGLKTYDQKGSLDGLLAKNYVVFGTTSGGAYNLMKYRGLGGKTVDWTTKTFDLVVIDEASQMSVPEGVLAGAFLKPAGSMIVVGDHRQMPPIIAHPWKDEMKRSVVDDKPFISLFEALVERGFPWTQLDESFRLHTDIAEFLRENIYSKDGIRFHSKRKEIIPQLPPLNAYVDSVMDPHFPIVVIEHSEQASQQYNLIELQLVQPLIEACVKHLSLDGRNGIGVVVPHRAQKALLRAQFPDLAEVNSIDTVERFQGDERDVIIVSATASDPDYVRAECDFLMNMNRLNVAISRPRKKLIVVASRSVIDLLTSDLEMFEQAMIWKRLFYHYTPINLFDGGLNGYQVRVRGHQSG